MAAKKSTRELFEEKIERIPEAGCWLWTAGVRHGYGMVTIKQKKWIAHRASWAIFVGPIPSGAWVLHRCDVPLCVNPAHLFLGTPMDNTRDMVAKRRAFFVPGGDHPHAKLAEAQALAIVDLLKNGAQCQHLAKQYAVSKATISLIAHGKRWKHLPR